MSFLFCDSITLFLLSSDPSAMGLKVCISVGSAAAPTSSPSAAYRILFMEPTSCRPKKSDDDFKTFMEFVELRQKRDFAYR